MERVRTFVRTGDLGALSKRSVRVPEPDVRERPQLVGRLASQYLLDESRLKRRETTVDLYLSNVGGRTVEVECSLPDEGGESGGSWHLPLVFLTKKDVAPNLDVTDTDGNVVPVPTKHQNIALTKKAVIDLIERGNLPLRRNPALRELIEEVIEKPPVTAYVCRIVFERKAPPEARKAIPLLRLLEDNFVLWVPVQGGPGSQHHFRICRQEIHPPDQILIRRPRKVTVTIPTAGGEMRVEAPSWTGRWTVRWRVAIERLLKAFALRPIEVRVRDREAGRASSSHLRLLAPPGFQVRNVRVAEILPTPGNVRRLREIDPLEDDVAIQGWDQNLGHVHLSKQQNPGDVYCRMTLALRGGVNTLWMLATVLTAALLWVVHHHSHYGPNTYHHFQLVFGWLGGFASSGHYLAISADNRQIVAAALLVGPAFASAWSLRSENGELLRSFLAGSRVLLLLSAALSVAAALALANVVPTHSGRYTAVEAYAAISYWVAAPMIASWVLASRPTWELFRKCLHTEERNLACIAGLAGVVALIGILPALPGRGAGVVVFGMALGMGAVAANSAGEPLRFSGAGTSYRPLAGVGCVPLFIAAGSLLGFYADSMPLEHARLGCLVVGAGLAITAGLLALWKGK